MKVKGWQKQKIQEYTCQYCQLTWFTTKTGLTMHEKHCKENPNKIESQSKGKKLSQETREKLSISHKIAHKEGRGNSWKKRNSGPSYPEKWWMNIIANEFVDKDYRFDFSCSKYFLDFTWIHKMIVIEIDGSQHQLKERREKDQIKDDFLKSLGWKILRIPWNECSIDPQQWIQIAKSFVDDGEIVPFEKRYKSKKELYEEDMLRKHGKRKIEFEKGSSWNKKDKKQWQERWDLIKDYDRTKWGWITLAIKETGLSKRVIENTCNYFGINRQPNKSEKSKKQLEEERKLQKYGKVKLERGEANRISEKENQRLLELIESYDKTLKGWRKQASIETGLTESVIRHLCERNGIEWRTREWKSKK